MGSVFLSPFLEGIVLRLRVYLQVNLLNAVLRLAGVESELEFGVIVFYLRWCNTFSWRMLLEQLFIKSTLKKGFLELLENLRHSFSKIDF